MECCDDTIRQHVRLTSHGVRAVQQAALNALACETMRQEDAATARLDLTNAPLSNAHALGAHLKASGRTAPRDVRMGRGYSIRANDMRFSIQHAPKGATPPVSFTREE